MPVDNSVVELFLAGASGAASGGVAAFYAAREAINVTLARLDERIIALQKRVDSDHGDLEDLTREFHRRIKE